MNTGMTLKQYRRHRFYRLVEAYKDAKTRLHTDEGKRDFIVLSVQLHIAKQDVPKSSWSLINK